MDFFTTTFNSREIALIIWTFLILSLSLCKKGVRSSALGLLKAIFQTQIFLALIAMHIYILICVYLYYRINLWGFFLIKDTIFWTFGTALVFLFKSTKAMNDEHFFKNILLDNLKFIIVLEFVINFYTFSLWVEVILVPIFIMFGIVIALVDYKPELLPAKKFIEIIIIVFGLIIILFTMYKIYIDYSSILSPLNIHSIIVPPILTLSYIPFLYFYALYMAYESLFVRLSIFFDRDKYLLKYTKIKVLVSCFLNLSKLNRISNKYFHEFIRLNSKKEIKNFLNNL